MTEWNWNGSRWWKFDFHTHTPKSDDYGKGPQQAQIKQRTPKEWLLDYMRAGIDCVAIMDHNSGAWIDKLRNALGDLEDATLLLEPAERSLHRNGRAAASGLAAESVATERLQPLDKGGQPLSSLV